MPAGLFASLAGAACEPMRKVCPVRRPRSILPGDSAPEGCLRDPYAPSRAVCATSSRSGSLHCPAFAATRPEKDTEKRIPDKIPS